MDFKKHRMRGQMAEEVGDNIEDSIEDSMRLLDSLPLSTLLDNPPLQEGFRDGKYIHISDLINKCPRAIAIHYVHKRQLYGMRMSHQLGMTFSQGGALAKYMEDHVRRVAPEHMYGGWQCDCKKTSKTDSTYEAVKGVKCKTCGSGLTNYKEILLVDDEYELSGNVDITLLFGVLFYINELKSIKKDGADGFVGLTQAKPLHRLQALFYVWLMVRSGRRVSDSFSVFYMNKSFEFKMDNQVKEFKISYKDYVKTLDPYLEDAKAIKIARQGGALPKRPCADICDQQAKKCELAPLCFNLDN